MYIFNKVNYYGKYKCEESGVFMGLADKIKTLKDVPNSAYYDFKYKFNYHSNKIEGSTFTLENILNLMQYDKVEGNHSFDDVIETKNSLELFDFVIDTLGEKITKTLLLEFHSLLKKNTKDDAHGFKGCFKKIPNMILGSNTKVAEPYEVEWKLDELIDWYYNLNNISLEAIAGFHVKFETIHPFQDGNGRIGRFLILKQCLENDIYPYLITEENIMEYRKSLVDSAVFYKFLNNCSEYKF